MNDDSIATHMYWHVLSVLLTGQKKKKKKKKKKKSITIHPKGPHFVLRDIVMLKQKRSNQLALLGVQISLFLSIFLCILPKKNYITLLMKYSMA